MFHNIQRQSGSMLVIALFVIIVMAGMAFALSRVISASSDSVVTEVYGLRAFSVARVGLEEVIYRRFPGGAAAGACDNVDSNVDYVNFGNIPEYTGCNFQANCSTIAIDDPDLVDDPEYLQFTSTGSCVVNNQKVISRTVQVDALLQP